MSLHYRRRGEIWHFYGTVRVGSQSFKIGERSTGQRTRSLAEGVGAAEEARLRKEALDGPKAGQRVYVIAEAIAAYTGRPKGVQAYDVARLLDFNDRIGAYPVAEAKAAWNEWLTTRGRDMKPATAARSRATFMAALNYGAEHLGFPAVRLPQVQQERVEGTVYLTRDEQDRLLAAYNRWVWPVAQVLCYQGLRCQEALQMDWRHVDLTLGTLHVPALRSNRTRGTKSGKGRTVPMHWRVRWALAMIWLGQDRPTTGHVFISQRGQPYADTRGLGGNPITQAHATACRAAGIKNFRPHDWRHHWASWMAMLGADTITLMRLGGWATPAMVARYVALAGTHLSATIDLLP